MSDEYKFIKFCLLPNEEPIPVSPYTPSLSNKKIFVGEWSTQFTLSGSEVYNIVLETNNENSHMVLYKLNGDLVGSTGDNLSTVFGVPEHLTGLPPSNIKARFLTGFVKMNINKLWSYCTAARIHSDQPGVFYHPNDFHSFGIQAPIRNTTMGGYFNIITVPLTLEPKCPDIGDIGHFQYYLNFRNMRSDDTIQYDIDVTMYFETEAPDLEESTIEYIQDRSTPYKLAEYIINDFASTRDQFVHFSTVWSSHPDLFDFYSEIHNSMKEMTDKWKELYDGIHISLDYGPEDEDWNNKLLVWRP